MDRVRIDDAFNLADKEVEMNAKIGVVREEVVFGIIESLYLEVCDALGIPPTPTR